MSRLGRISAVLALAGTVLAPLPAAQAQSVPVFQTGALALPGGLAKFWRNGEVGDVGGLNGDSNGLGVNPFAIQDGDAAGLSLNTGPTGAAYGALTLGHDSTGAAVIGAAGYGGAPAPALKIEIGPTDTVVATATASGIAFGGVPTAPAPGNSPPSGQVATVGFTQSQIGAAGVAPVPFVATDAALAALATTTTTRVMRCGFAAQGDSPCQMFLAQTGTCASNGLANDGGDCVNTTAGDGNSWRASYAGAVDAAQFGGTTDAAFQAADAAAKAENKTLLIDVAFTLADTYAMTAPSVVFSAGGKISTTSAAPTITLAPIAEVPWVPVYDLSAGGNLIGPSEPTLTVGTNAALEALDTRILANVRRCGIAAPGDSPCVEFTAGSAACGISGGDVGSQNPSANSLCWLREPTSVQDPREFGAKGNVETLHAAATTTAASGAVAVTGANFTAADIGKLITITDIIGSPTPAGATYQGAITAVGGATEITVSPAVSFSTTGTQYVAYGSDDTAALNAWATYVGTLPANAADFVAAAGGGARFGVSGPVDFPAGGAYSHFTLQALATTGFTCANGLATVASENTSFDQVGFDSGYLPVDGYYLDDANGVTSLTGTDARHWQGSCGTATASATQSTVGSYVIDVASTTGLATSMVSRGNSGVGIPDRAIIEKVESSTTDSVSPCPGSLCIVINRPTTAALSAQSVTFDQDADGYVLAGANAGAHFNHVVAMEYDAGDTAHVASGDHYGYGLFDQGTQTTAVHFYGGGGVAPVAMDSTANGLILIDAHLFNSPYSSTETNPVVLNEAGGAKNLDFESGSVTGVYQRWILDATVPTDAIGFGSIQWNAVTASANDVVQIYSDQTSTNNTDLAIGPAANKNTTNGYVSWGGIGTCGVNYSYDDVSCAQATAIAALVSGYSHVPRGPLATTGLNGVYGTLSNILDFSIVETMPYTLDVTAACPSVGHLESTATLTLPNLSAPGCVIHYTSNFASTIGPASGATIDFAGTAYTNPATIPFPAATNVTCWQARFAADATWGCTGDIPGAGSNTLVSAPAAPASTSAFTMEGLDATLTPQRTGNVLVIASGTITSTVTTAGTGITFQFAFGTGTAPANGAADTGTALCSPVTYTIPATATAAADVNVPFSIQCWRSGLTPGTAAWFDFRAKALGTAGDVSLSNVAVSAVEQ